MKMNKYLIKYSRNCGQTIEKKYVFAETHSKAYVEFVSTHDIECVVVGIRCVKKGADK